MWDFLTFQTFITPTLLIVSYFVGAVLMPIVSLLVTRYLKKQIVEHVTIDREDRYKYLFYLSMILCFLSMEIAWRVLFEFMIAYFDMHDALMQMVNA